MRNKKKSEDKLNNRLNVDEKIIILKNLLGSLKQILITFYPLLNKNLLRKEVELYKKDGTFNKLIQLFDDISKECRKISSLVFNSKTFNINGELKN